MVRGLSQGDVYWLDFGSLAASAPVERHPCVVVQSYAFNRSRIATTVVCPIASNMDGAAVAGNVSLRKGEAGPPKPCVVNVSQVVTVDKIEMEERVGRISGSVLASVLTGLWLVFEGD